MQHLSICLNSLSYINCYYIALYFMVPPNPNPTVPAWVFCMLLPPPPLLPMSLMCLQQPQLALPAPVPPPLLHVLELRIRVVAVG